VIIEIVAITTTGLLALIAAGIVFALVRAHGIGARDVEIISRKSGDKLRVSKSSDGIITSIEIVNPSADVKNMLMRDTADLSLENTPDPS
jgi:hypothetical protein